MGLFDLRPKTKREDLFDRERELELLHRDIERGFPRGNYLWVAVVVFKCFFVSGFPRLARVFTASLRGLSGLYLTQKPLIRFKPLNARFHEATTSLVVTTSPSCTKSIVYEF